MKRCDFCDHKCRTENNEEICVKRLICLDDLKDFPCGDFSVSITTKGLRVLLLAVIIAITLVGVLS